MTAATLSRRGLLRTGAAAAALAGLPMVPARAAGPYSFSPRQIADGVWMIEGARESFARSNGGAICNVVMIETAVGAVVIDSGSTVDMGQAIRGFAETRLGGVAVMMNTHHHPDHWFGNAAFDPASVLALPRTIAACRENAQGYSDALYAILGPWMSGTVPAPATEPATQGEMRIGGRVFDLMALSGHTAADLAILDAETGTLIAGDLLFLDRAPSLPDADIAEWRRTLDTLGRVSASGVVPGHGPYRTSSEAFVQTRAYLDAIDLRLTRAAEDGLTPMEAIAAGPVPEFAGLGANPAEYARSVIQRWSDYETQALPVVGGT